MGSFWLFRKAFVAIFTLFLAFASWHAELQAAGIYLTWQDTSPNEAGFKIERLVAGLVDATLTVSAGTTSFTDSGLVTGTVYCYRVKAFNSAGDSDSSNQACVTASGTAGSATASLSANPTNASPGGSVTASWSGIAAPTTTDWIGLYAPGAADTDFINWLYVSCSTVPAASRASGSCPYILPTTLSQGKYDLRLFANDGYLRLATSTSLTVSNSPSPSLTVSPTTVKAGATVTASWSGITAPTPKDWIGLYAPGATDKAFINWIYVSCSMTAAAARTSGSCSYPLPATLAAGTYELRLFANDDFTRLVTSRSFTVTVGGTTSPTLTVSPTTAKPGTKLTTTWTGITTPAPKDWIGLYAPGTADTKFINWVYVSCSMTAAAARTSGSCSYPLPTTLAAGTYELRLFANDEFKRLATSGVFTVTTSINLAQTTILANVTSKPTNGSNSSSMALVPIKWADYDFTLKLQSKDNNTIGVMFRYQDDKNYYRFLWNRHSKFRRLEKMQNGVVTALANDATAYIKGQTYGLQILVQGPALRVMIDGSQIFSVTDSAFIDGTIGLYSSSNSETMFDDILVKDLATGATLLSDNFNDGNFSGWTVVDQSPNVASSWSAAGGSLVQSSNINGTFAIYTLRNWNDYRLTLKMQSLDRDSIGVMFRYQDNDNYYRFSWNRRNDFRRLEKRQNGVFTVLAEDSKAYTINRTYQLEIIADGTALKVGIDGESILSALDTSFDRGTVALYSSSNQGSIFDDILVEDLATEAVLLQNDFNNKNFAGWTIIDDKDTRRAPSAWSAQSGALLQSSPIGSNNGTMLGTYVLH